MNKMDAFRHAVAVLGDAPHDKLSSFIEENYEIKIDSKVIPVFLASMRDLDKLILYRQAANAAKSPSEKQPGKVEP